MRVSEVKEIVLELATKDALSLNLSDLIDPKSPDPAGAAGHHLPLGEGSDQIWCLIGRQ